MSQQQHLHSLRRFSTISLGVASRALAHLCLVLALIPGAQALGNTTDEQFLAAEEAYRIRDIKGLEHYAKALKEHPLADYPQFWYLDAALKDASPAQVKEFLKRHPDGPLAQRLRVDWLKLLGKNQQWEEFVAQYPQLVNEDTEVTCYDLKRRALAKDKQAVQSAKGLWLAGRSQPDSCESLFDALYAGGDLSGQEIWERLRLALEAGQIPLARRINDYLPAEQALNEKQLERARRDPAAYLGKKPLASKSRANRELAIYAILQIARKDPLEAVSHWNNLAQHYAPKDQSFVWSQIAYQGALEHQAAALEWYKKAGDLPLSDSQLAWKARAALRSESWPDVLAAIEQMSSSEAQQSQWRYWKARSFKIENKNVEANEIFLPLAKEATFYGKLASEELGAVLSNANEVWKPSGDELKSMENQTGLQRAQYLNRLGLWLEGIREWNWAIRNFDDKQLLTASEVARRAGWHDRSINTAERTQQLHDFSLRFPVPFREALQAGAKQNQLDEAWVYGIVRQESRFYADARSRTGALGLMQLMPATAHWVAKRLGLAQFRTADITQVDMNATFGSFYLRHVLDELGHPVLATAAYNAGPRRAARWRDARAMEGAVYAESIPFNETRDYVKKVMTNAATYASLLGLESQSLKKRLGVIPAKTAVAETETEPVSADTEGE